MVRRRPNFDKEALLTPVGHAGNGLCHHQGVFGVEIPNSSDRAQEVSPSEGIQDPVGRNFQRSKARHSDLAQLMNRLFALGLQIGSLHERTGQ